MCRRSILSLAFVFAVCLTREVSAGEVPPTEVNAGWVHVSESDRGWRIERIRELGDWNLSVLEGDLLTQIAGQDASNLGPISAAELLASAMGQKIAVTVERKGRVLQLEVFAGEEDRDRDAEAKRLYAQYGTGLVVGSGADGSVIVLSVRTGSPAEKSDLHKDDEIFAVDGKDVGALEISQVRELLRSDRPSPVKLHVLRGNKKFEVTVNRVPMSDLYPRAEAAFPIHKRGELAPTFELINTQGKRVRLEDFRGQWVLLNFWGVWCGACQFELPFLDVWSKRFAGRLVILGLDVNDKPDVLARYLARHPRPYQILAAGQLGEPLANAYALGGVPQDILVDPKGAVRYVELGFEPALPGEPPLLERYLQSILQ